MKEILILIKRDESGVITVNSEANTIEMLGLIEYVRGIVQFDIKLNYQKQKENQIPTPCEE